MTAGEVDLPVNMSYHGIPRSAFNALATGRGGPEAIRALAVAQYSKHLVLLRGVLSAAEGAGAEQAWFARRGWELLTEVERLDHDAAAWVTRYPAVGAWAVRTLLRPGGAGGVSGAVPSRMAAVAAAAAIRSGTDVEIPVMPVAGVVSLPSLGSARVDADLAVVRSQGGRTEVRWAGGRVKIPPDSQWDAAGWLGVRSCRAGRFQAVIEDTDPFRMPTVSGVAPRLTAPHVQHWADTLQQGWRVLEAGHPGIAAEVAAAVSVIVPLSESVHGQLSSSSPETFGAIAMSEPADPSTCASTLTHELQHLKLCAVLDIVRLTEPDDGRRYFAPWRGDPRPAAGLLQGAYAYLGVTEFWRRQRQLALGSDQLRAETEFARWSSGTTRVIGTLLASGRLTPAGTDFVERMSEMASEWASEPVSALARESARRESRSHLARWELANGPVSD